MLFTIILFLMVGGMIAITTNRDIFSPAKFFLFFFALFHAGAVLDPPENAVVFLMLVTLLIGVFAALIEAVRMQYDPTLEQALASAPASSPMSLNAAAFFWLISVPPVFAQLYMIQQFGGLEGYVASIGTRVVDWTGYGWARVLINFMPTINVAYLAVGLMKRRSLRWWAFFAAHLAIVLMNGSLSGSRSGLLNVLALLMLVFHYLRRPVGAIAATWMAFGLMLAASALGVARNGFRLVDGQLQTGFATSGESFGFNSFNYGVDPLKLIVSTPYMPLAEGSTFLSLVTNSIPRSIYPEKPDTGGVFFTKNYAGDAWEGYSNLTPTFIGEWIINFGYLVGVIMYVLVYGAIILGLIALYRRIPRNSERPRDQLFALDVAIYVHVLWSCIALMVGELTSTVLGMLLSQLLPLLAIRAYFRYRMRPASAAAMRPGVAPNAQATALTQRL